MKSSLSNRSTSNKQKIRLSRRELEQLVEKEVSSAVKKKESSVDALLENIQQQLDQGMSYEATAKALQARMMAVSLRAEQALAHIEQNPTSLLGDTSFVWSPLKTDSIKTESQYPDRVEVSSVCDFMERTKKEFQHLHAENAALKAAFEDIRERTTPSPTINIRQPSGVFQVLAKLIKKEPTEHPEDPCPSPKVSLKRVKEEPCSPEEHRHPKRIKSEPEEVTYPPLPVLPFPSFLPVEAAKYNIPPRLKVELALIKNPSPQLSLVWNLEEDDPNAPPMDTYSIFITTEAAVGSSMFNAWQKLAELAAGPLPMFFLHLDIKPGQKICVSVIGKDVFGRYGPHSKVACAYL